MNTILLVLTIAYLTIQSIINFRHKKVIDKVLNYYIYIVEITDGDEIFNDYDSAEEFYNKDGIKLVKFNPIIGEQVILKRVNNEHE